MDDLVGNVGALGCARGGRNPGVVLANGDDIRAKRVISNMDAKRAFLKHVDEDALPHDFVLHLRDCNIRG